MLLLSYCFTSDLTAELSQCWWHSCKRHKTQGIIQYHLVPVCDLYVTVSHKQCFNVRSSPPPPHWDRLTFPLLHPSEAQSGNNVPLLDPFLFPLQLLGSHLHSWGLPLDRNPVLLFPGSARENMWGWDRRGRCKRLWNLGEETILILEGCRWLLHATDADLFSLTYFHGAEVALKTQPHRNNLTWPQFSRHAQGGVTSPPAGRAALIQIKGCVVKLKTRFYSLVPQISRNL